MTSDLSGWPLLKNKQKITRLGEDVEKMEFLCVVSGSVK